MGRRRRSKTTEPTPEQEELPLPESRLIDEMNIVETPFALLSQRNTSIRRFDLTPNGDRYLASSEAHLLPTALAEQVVLGLMWMYREVNGFSERKLTFHLRELVENYIYPGKYSKVRAPGNVLQSVKDQLHRVAATRIYSDKWYDHKLGRHVQMDAAIIDYVALIQKGGKNSAQVIEIAWGEKFFESLCSKYTKDLDPSIYLQIDKPIDRRLFRWIDRQLYQKSEQKVASIQLFARSKLGMSGAVIDKGGRTASTYVAKNLKAAVERLNGIGFPIRLEVDTSVDDYQLIFLRKSGGPNETEEIDNTGDLLHQFAVTFHGGTRRRKYAKADRTIAENWLAAYGAEASYWMLEEVKRIQERRKAEKPLTFRALSLYEDACWGAWRQKIDKQEAIQQSRLPSQPARPAWDTYIDYLLSRIDVDEHELSLQAERIASRLEQNPGWEIMGKRTRQKWIEAEVRLEQMDACHVLSKAEYEALTTEQLERELRKRHKLSISEFKF